MIPDSPILLVQLRDRRRRGDAVHLALTASTCADARTVRVLCGLAVRAEHAVVLTTVTGVPCPACVLAGAWAGAGRRVQPTGPLRGYLIGRDLALNALDLLARRGTPAPALADDLTPYTLLVLSVTPFDRPLPWPQSVRPVDVVPALPHTDDGPLRWHHLPTTDHLSGDLDLCLCLVSVAVSAVSAAHS